MINDDTIPSPAKIDFAFGSSDVKVKPPGSVIHPVIPPSLIVIRAIPSGTTILLPFVIIPFEPLLFSPLPALLLCCTAGKTAAVAGTPCIGTMYSFH